MRSRIHRVLSSPRRSTLLLLAVALGAAWCWDSAREASRLPFRDLRWEAGHPHVQLGDRWYELVSLNGAAASSLAEQAIERWGPAYQDRFASGLGELLRAEGRASGTLCRLVLERDSVVTTRTAFSSRHEWVKYRDAEAARQVVCRSRSDPLPEDLSFVTHRVDGQSPGPDTPWLTAGSARADVERLEWYLIHRYAYLERRAVPYRAALDRIAAGLGGGISRRDFALQIDRALSLFDDLHTSVLVRRSGVGDPDAVLACEFMRLDGRVACLLPGKRGFLDSEYPFVRSLDGVPVERVLEFAGVLVPRPSADFHRDRALDHLRSLDLTRSLTGRSDDEDPLLELESRDGLRSRTQRLRSGAATDEAGFRPTVERRVLPDRIGYLGLRAGLFPDGEFRRRILDALRALSETRGLILDLRGNGGGSRAAIPLLLSHLLAPDTECEVLNVAALRMDRAVRPPSSAELLRTRLLYSAASDRWTPEERARIAAFRESLRPAMELDEARFSDWHFMLLRRPGEKDGFHYDRPVLVLQDEETASAADFLLAALKNRPGIRLMGRRSAGGSGYPVEYLLPGSGLVVQLSAMVSLQPDGSIFDGTEPDIPHARTLADLERELLDGVDSMLLRARELLLRH